MDIDVISFLEPFIFNVIKDYENIPNLGLYFSNINFGTLIDIIVSFAMAGMCLVCILHPICCRIVFVPMVLGVIGGNIADLDSNIVSSIFRLLLITYECKFSFSLSYLTLIVMAMCYIFVILCVVNCKELRNPMFFRPAYLAIKLYCSVYLLCQLNYTSTCLTTVIWLIECMSSCWAADPLTAKDILQLSMAISIYEYCLKIRNFISGFYLLRILSSYGSWSNSNCMYYLLQAVIVSISSVESFTSFVTCGSVLYLFVWTFDSKSCALLIDIGELFLFRYIADSFIPEYIFVMPKQYMPYRMHTTKHSNIHISSLVGRRVAFQEHWYTGHDVGIVEKVIDEHAYIKIETVPLKPNSIIPIIEIKKLKVLSSWKRFLKNG